MNRLEALAARRALLVSQCELDRIELAIACLGVRRALELDAAPGGRGRPWLRRAVAMSAPLLGATRAGRLSRYVSFGVLAWRIATGTRHR